MPSKDNDRPNVVFILSDDQGPWALGCAGNDEIRTPTLDGLAEEGIRFDDFFCASPVCSPARASVLTGRIPSQHGVHDWLRDGNAPSDKDWGAQGKVIEYLHGMTGYTDVLAAHGYTCGISGKWHLGDSFHPQKGFSFWHVHSRGGSGYYNAPIFHEGREYVEPRYVTDTITDHALEFLDEQPGSDAPFYLSVHYTAPHSPWNREEHPDETYSSYYDNCPFDSVPNVPMHPWQVRTAPTGFDEESRRTELSGYFAAVTEMDRNIARILHKLDEMGVRDNTLVVFMSDNGMNMGHHGLYGKGNATFPMNMYDTSVKVPLIVSLPGRVPAGVVNTNMLSQYDSMPTLLDYLGMANPESESLPGKSFAPILRGEKLAGTESVIVYDEYGPVRMIRTRDWKYVHRYPYGPHELYHLAADPNEETNLVDDEARRGVREELKAQLDEWFARWVDPRLDGAREPVTGTGQEDLAGPGGRGRAAFRQERRFMKDE